MTSRPIPVELLSAAGSTFTGLVTLRLLTILGVFPGGVGKTWEPGAFEQLLDDVNSRVLGAYGDETVVYPWHGDGTVLGAGRPHLAEWRERGW